MSETDFDVEGLKDEIRREVAERRRSSRSHEPRPGTGDASPLGRLPQGTELSHLRSVISAADAESDVGLHMPPMVRFQGFKRKLALFAGRQVLYLSSFITEKQRSFNKMAVYALWEMSKLQEKTLSALAGGSGGGRVERLEARIEEQERELRELRERLEQLTGRLEEGTEDTGNKR